MTSEAFGTAVIGGGIVGLAAARALGESDAVLLEAEPEVGRHQSGHNSGVIHSGLYYKPGSLKATLCTAGRERMFRFCEEHGIPHRRCGKLVVATSEDELPRLDELERRGRANGLEGLRRLGADELAEHEPEIRGVAGLWIVETGVVDFRQVTRALVGELKKRGVEVRTGCRLTGAVREGGGWRLTTSSGELRSRRLLNCAGLHSDRVARLCGAEPGVRIVPFRGEYHRLRPEAARRIRGLVYPVPDPRFPFLGVHFTRTIDDRVEVGPNAVLAWSRHGYTRTRVSLRDTAETLSYPGFRRLVRRHWRMAVAETHRSWSLGALARELATMLPGIEAGDLEPAGAGVRAQAVAPDGALVDDFHLIRGDGMLHVLNAPSPAATASLAIGEAIVGKLVD